MDAAKKAIANFDLNGTAIKGLACLAMFFDHAAKALSWKGAAYFLSARLIGRIAFPIFCFFLVEGFVHSRNRLRYFFRVLLFACLAELPFDLALYRNVPYLDRQNTLFSLSLGLLLFFLLHSIEKHSSLHVYLARFLKLLCTTSVCLLAHLCRVDYGARGILCMAVFYFLKTIQPHSLAAFWGCLCINLNKFANPGAFLAMLPLHFYRGKRGHLIGKYFFYCFYPAHLALLVLLRRFFS